MARKCKSCGAALSSYNTGLLCWPCQEKKKDQLQEQIGDTPHYTVDNLRFLLGFKNPESVKRLGRNGTIPGRFPGIRQHLYLRDEVDRWIRRVQKDQNVSQPPEQAGSLETASKEDSSGTEESLPIETLSNTETSGTEQPTFVSESACPAPPDNIDVATLKSWGVPSRKAPAILYRWRESHMEDSHEMCEVYHMLEDDLRIRKIPFKEAELLLDAGLWATKFGSDKLIRDIEISRRYQSLQNIHNCRYFFKEIQRLDKPILEARQKHLEEIANLLKALHDVVFNALSKQEYDDIFQVESNILFESLMTHCFDVANNFYDLKFNRGRIQYLDYELVAKVTKGTRSEASNKIGGPKNEELLVIPKRTAGITRNLLKAIEKNMAKKSYLQTWCFDYIKEPHQS